jgi:hypothetical protein
MIRRREPSHHLFGGIERQLDRVPVTASFFAACEAEVKVAAPTDTQDPSLHRAHERLAKSAYGRTANQSERAGLGRFKT